MKITLRNSALLVVLAALMILSACAGKQEAPTAQLANPMKEVTFDEMVETAGIPLYAPEKAEDIHYFTIDSGDAIIAQMDFTLDGKAYTYRATYADLDAEALSGIYFTKATESYAEVSYAEGKFLTEGNTSVLYWEDIVPGARYSLCSTDCENPIVLLEIAENTFRPLQDSDNGEGYAEMPTELPDLEGTYTDENGNTVTLIPTGENNFEATVSIVRLSQFEGTGKLDPICMDLTLEDPNGQPLYAEFYKTDDGTCTLIISESLWDLLESGTQFTGFTRTY